MIWKSKLKKIIKSLFLLGILFYLAICAFFYFNQEKFYFQPKKLAKDYTYNFSIPFEEINIPTGNNIYLNSILFKTKNSKGVVLYYHGNAGAIHEWGKRANLYTDIGYDVWFVDYRGYGKSHDKITNEKILLDDALTIYNYVKTKYNENNISVLGFSIGSGLAAKVASKNNPKQLILEAPYYSFESLIKNIAPFYSFIYNHLQNTN